MIYLLNMQKIAICNQKEGNGAIKKRYLVNFIGLFFLVVHLIAPTVSPIVFVASLMVQYQPLMLIASDVGHLEQTLLTAIGRQS